MGRHRCWTPLGRLAEAVSGAGPATAQRKIEVKQRDCGNCSRTNREVWYRAGLDKILALGISLDWWSAQISLTRLILTFL